MQVPVQTTERTGDETSIWRVRLAEGLAQQGWSGARQGDGEMKDNNNKDKGRVGYRVGLVVMVALVVGLTASAAWAAPAGGIGEVRSFVSLLTTYVTVGVALLVVALLRSDVIRAWSA